MARSASNRTDDTRTPRGENANFEHLDRLFHERARLAILTALSSRPEGVVFNDLKEICNLTDGNLSRHLQSLRETRVVELWKRQSGGRPQTLIKLTPSGRARFLQYLDALEEVVRSAIAASRRETGPIRRDALGRGEFSPA
ncbi:MAG: transcriptional regulator [Planctomycetes bacterium]|nr:transcriptional regulator [Planctomycetota bacterium]